MELFVLIIIIGIILVFIVSIINNGRIELIEEKNDLEKDISESYTEYFDHDPTIVKETGYKIDGIKNGLYISYESHEGSGKISEEGTYKDGKKHGIVKLFSPMFQSFPMEVQTYNDGIKNGPYQEYYFGSNVLFEEGFYKDGKKSGSYTQYDESGNVEENGTHLTDDSIKE